MVEASLGARCPRPLEDGRCGRPLAVNRKARGTYLKGAGLITE